MGIPSGVKRVLMVAGEASGDLHGSGVVRELKKRNPACDVYGIGGDAMQREGMDIVEHIRHLAFMGFVEVVGNLSTIRRVETNMERLLDERKPDVVVLIDYPGFNLRLARAVKKRHIPIVYYISPQVWAWHKSRVRTMKTLIDRMMVVFPFEVEIYRKENIPVEFVGHPIVERIGSTTGRTEFFAKHGFDPSRKLLGLFPGSRMQEIERILPAMAETARAISSSDEVSVALGVAPNLGWKSLEPFIPAGVQIVPVENETYDLMAHADVAMVTSGTATLETGWFGTPMMIVYRTSPLTYAIGRMLVDVPYIGLANIVAGEKIVPEFIQNDVTVKRMLPEAQRLLGDDAYAGAMRSRLGVIRQKLGGPGASAKVADAVESLGSHL